MMKYQDVFALVMLAVMVTGFVCARLGWSSGYVTAKISERRKK